MSLGWSTMDDRVSHRTKPLPRFGTKAWLQTTSEGLGLENPAIQLSEPVKWENVGSRLDSILRVSGSLESIGDLLHTLANGPVRHRITGVRMRDWDQARNQLRMEVDLQAILLAHNPSYDPDLLSNTGHRSELNQPTPLGEFLTQRSPFSRYERPIVKAPEITLVEEVPIELPKKEKPPKVDLLGSVRLVGIVERDGSARALFRDAMNGIDHVIDTHEELKFDSFTATLERFEGDRILLKQGKSEFYVSLGQTLRQGINSERGLDSFE